MGEDTNIISMEGMASLWSCQEVCALNAKSVEELKHKLLCTTMELESLRANAKEEMKRSEENINQLILLLEVTSQERDEARVQLQLLLNTFTQPTSDNLLYPVISLLQPDSLPARLVRGNSSTSESEGVSATPKHHSGVSSPVESFFDAASSLNLSNLNTLDPCNVGGARQHPFNIECNNNYSSTISSYNDHASAVIDDLAKKKALPEKGKLLQAVIEAGPLLDTLLLAGPLPQWRNPPPLQPLQSPLVDGGKYLTALLTPNYSAKSSSAPLNVSNTSSLCVKRSPAVISSMGGYQRLASKRQRSQ